MVLPSQSRERTRQMSVATQLGLDGPDNAVLTSAALQWDTWVFGDGRLAVLTGGIGSLRQWLRTADPAAADDVLHGLARLGSPTGEDSLLAARVLAWALLPGASSLARRLASLSPDIDAIVAAQLWLEIRSFPWSRLRKVAANILANTRVGVLRECGVASQLHRVDRAWAQSRLVDPQAAMWADLEAAPSRSAAEELSAVLDWACDRQVIDGQERSLLLSLV